MTTRSATARWRALKAEADRLWDERESLTAQGRFSEAIEMSPRVQVALQKAFRAEKEMEEKHADP